MARVTGPLHSDSASGTFANSMTFAGWKGRPYVRQRVVPANPRSAGQLGVRAMMKYLAQIWSSIGATPQASWDTTAAARAISAFNAFVSHNLDRWQSSYGPTWTEDAAEAGTVGTAATTKTGAAGYATIAGTPNVTTDADAAYAIICRATAEITAPSWANAIAVIPVVPNTAWTYTDSPLDAGTYHYRVAYGTDTGKLGTFEADETAVVT